jgi:nucleotide-binding universal stress UspA family protein
MKVLIPLDGSQPALAALDHICTLRREGADIEALLLHVCPRLSRHSGRFVSREAREGYYTEECKAAAARAVSRLAAAGVPFRVLMTIGPTAEYIARVAEQERVDQIIIGAGRQPEWLRRLFSSLADCVMARTDIPVTVLQLGHVGLLERYGVPAGALWLAAWFLVAE